MAVRDVSADKTGNVKVAVWADLDAGDSGKPIYMGDHPIMSLQIIGGTSVDIQGSNDGGTTWAAVTKDGTNALTTATPGLYPIFESALLIRPNNVAGNNMKIVLTGVA